MKAKIDWDNRQIIGKSGKVYRIMPEMLSTGRTPEFEIRAMTLSHKTDFETIIKLIDKSYNTLYNFGITKDEVKLGSLFDLLEDLKNFRNGLLNFQLNNRSALVEFCALFCISEDEDLGLFNEQIIREKYEDWSEIPEADFFLLSAKAIPYFKQRYLELLSQENQKVEQK